MPYYNRNKQFNPENRKPPAEIYFYDNSPAHGYYGFKLYFPDENIIEINKTIENVKCSEQFIERNTFDLLTIKNEKSFTIDYKSILEDEIAKEWGELEHDLQNNTEYCLNCLSLAMHQSILNACKEDELKSANLLPVIRAKLINYEPILQLKDLRVNYYGKLVAIRGTVIKSGTVKIIAQYLTFTCSLCSGVQIHRQVDGVYTVPTKCLSRGCRATSYFVPQHSSPFTRTIMWQSLKVQELVENEQYENNRIPRTLECELMGDLVNKSVPGDDVTITGVIKVQNSPQYVGKNQQSSVFLLHLEAISIVNNKTQSQGSYASERITFNIKDYYSIQKIHAEPCLFKFLVHSLCPNIYGHEIVKAGLLLALFGGTKSDMVRGESHILIVGDPGLGKSQMLQACANVAPRGVYVCGNTSTSSGLTVTVTRESGREYALEAGALMLADQGCCCIDEFDKMPSQHACLLEAMEQQSISVAKAGIVCTLPTRTTILAAANPAGGHYNKAKTVAENLKIGSPMLSRFDLIFVLLDQPNEQIDRLLSEHVLAVHSDVRVKSTFHPEASTSFTGDTLKERLKLQENERIDHLPHVLFRKYIAYAQKYVNPVLSDGAKTVLKDFYLQLRKQFLTGDWTPITTRQLHSLVRLTQARAKLELREEATQTDALEVVEIMRECLMDIFTDDVGILDTTRSQNSTGSSSKNQVVKLLRLLHDKSDLQKKSIFTMKEMRELAQSVGIDRNKFLTVFDSLNLQGFILNKGNNNYQLISTNF